jgi:hypothetical protein
MVNVTYDSCESFYLTLDSRLTASLRTAGSMISTGEDGTVVLYNPGDIAWTLTSTALVWFMIPGVGFFYSGLLRRKNALSMIYMSVMVAAVASVQVCSGSTFSRARAQHDFQWFFWGYSLVYSDTGGPFIGDLRKSSNPHRCKAGIVNSAFRSLRLKGCPRPALYGQRENPCNCFLHLSTYLRGLHVRAAMFPRNIDAHVRLGPESLSGQLQSVDALDP